MRLSLLASLFILASFAAACVARAPTNQSDGFKALLAEDWNHWMREYPEVATSLGVAGHNARWTDYSPQAIDARKAYLRQLLPRMTAIDRASLSSADQLNYDLYRDMIASAVDGLEFENDALPLRSVIPHNLLAPMNQMEGAQQDIPRIIGLMPVARVGDFEDLVKRLEAVPALIDQTIALMRRGLAQGATPPQITFRDVPGQVQAQIVADPAASPLLAAFKAFPPSIPAADRDRLTAAATAAYTNAVKPAFSRLHEFLVQTYLPGCRTTTSIAATPKGAAMYAHNVRWHTTTSRSPQEIHDIGVAEVKRIRGEMDAVLKRVAWTGTFDGFKQHLRTNPAFFHKSGDSLVAGYRDIAKRADPELARLFGRLPRTPYGVVRMADAIAPSQTTAFYEPGALAAGRPGNMHANTFKLDARPTWEMEALTLHEAVPGHHLQISIAQELEGLPEFRKHMSYTAFVEGWALYAESLGDEMGFYDDAYAKFGQLTYDMWRAVRLVVDTGLHAMNWTRQQAIDFFKANAAKTEQDITVEVDRYIVWPGQALGYKMGQLRVRELRTQAEQQLKGRFDIRRFHDVVLGQGAVPMDVLQRLVEDWIATVPAR